MFHNTNIRNRGCDWCVSESDEAGTNDPALCVVNDAVLSS
jgi:hypothetical protein